VKLDEIARLAGVSRTTASYVINGKAKQYRVSDKTVEKVMAVVREHNYHPNAVAAGLRAGRTRSIGLVIPDLENTSYTRIANYLERQARQRGYQLLIACSEDQPDNEMRCIEHLLQRQVDAIIVSTSLPPEHPFYQRWANDPFPIVALDRALDREHFTSVVGADQDDAEMLAAELRKFPGKTSCILARYRSCRSVSCVNRASVPRGMTIRVKCSICTPTALNAKRQGSCLRNGWKRIHAAGAVHNLISAVAGGDGCDAASGREAAVRTGYCDLRR
jgi:D-fructose-responsive transcription factor